MMMLLLQASFTRSSTDTSMQVFVWILRNTFHFQNLYVVDFSIELVHEINMAINASSYMLMPRHVYVDSLSYIGLGTSHIVSCWDFDNLVLCNFFVCSKSSENEMLSNTFFDIVI